MSVRVSLSNSDSSFSAAADESVLDAALRAGRNLPHSCKGGNCGACRARLLRGTVSYPSHPNAAPLGLGAAEVAEGFILLCQARASSDLRIETFEISTPETATIKRLPARIERATVLSHDVIGLHLRLPAAEPFHFEAGQYIDILLPGGRRRSFSIACPPHDSRLLELHIRRVPGGEFTEQLFADATRRELLMIEGPLGQFSYRDDAASASTPMVLIGGGTGLAPLNAILRHVVELGIDREMLLFWGVRSEPDLYAHARLEALARASPNLRYVPVLSEASPAWAGRRGWVHDAALCDTAALGSFDVYASGPPAMIAAVRAEFGRRGTPASRIFFDSFDYAPDTLERHRLMAASKS